MNQAQFKTTINCGGCIKSVTPFLDSIPEIVHWEVDTNNHEKILTVFGDLIDPDEVIRKVKQAGFEISAIPAGEGKLVGILIQFPVSFKNTDDRRMYLMKLSQLFRYHRLFVEVRHDSWISPSMFNFFQENHLHPVNVDLPPLPRHMPLTQESWGDMSYFRLMGRNSETWYNSNLGERYSYFYSDVELFHFLKLIKHTKKESPKTCVVFHNDPNAFSLVNGFQLKRYLRRRQRVLVPHTLVEAHPSLKPICSRVNTQHPLFAE